MISVVVCTRSPEAFGRFAANVESTIGVPFELVPVDNSANAHSIFSAYNYGAALAKGDLICFSHDDVLFHEDAWGKRIESHFKSRPDLGILGFYGSNTVLPSVDWRDCIECISSHYVQHVRTLEKDARDFRLALVDKRDPVEDGLSEVQVLDGFCFFIPATLMSRLSFDEDRFGGFHQYDTDISLQVRALGYKACVCHDVFPEHFSPGFVDQRYYDALELVFRKWDDSLIEKLPGVDLGPLRERAASASQEKPRANEIRRKHSCGEALDREEMKRVHDSVVFYHHVFNKTAASLDEALAQISESRRRGVISRVEAFVLRIKAVKYQTLRKFACKSQREKFVIFTETK